MNSFYLIIGTAYLIWAALGVLGWFLMIRERRPFRIERNEWIELSFAMLGGPATLIAALLPL